MVLLDDFNTHLGNDEQTKRGLTGRKFLSDPYQSGALLMHKRCDDISTTAILGQ